MIQEFYCGSYGEEHEDGIVKFRLDTEAGTLSPIFSHKGIYHPSYLARDGKKGVVYAAAERTPEGTVHCLKEGADGLFPMGSLGTGGAGTCHVSLDSEGKFLFAGNYLSGSLAVFSLDGSGALADRTQLFSHQGRGLQPVRQAGPHVHFCGEFCGTVFVSDLGLDKVFLYQIDPANGGLRFSGKFLELPAGSGPRHLAGDGERIYVVCELTNEVVFFEWDGEQYVRKQRISTLPDGFFGASKAAAVRLSGDFLFVSNRGHDSIAVFWISEDGRISPSQIFHTGGRSPRDFELFGDFLAAANQESDRITVFHMDWENGKAEDTGISAEMRKPCCILRAGEEERG